MRSEQYADTLTSLNLGITGSLDKDANQKLVELVAKLTRQENQTRHIPPGMVSVMVQPKDVDRNG